MLVAKSSYASCMPSFHSSICNSRQTRACSALTSTEGQAAVTRRAGGGTQRLTSMVRRWLKLSASNAPSLVSWRRKRLNESMVYTCLESWLVPLWAGVRSGNRSSVPGKCL
jgi:hypothetical protein